MCGVCATYVWRNLDFTAYQRRSCGVSRVSMAYTCAMYVSLLWSMCDVLGVLEIFCGVPRES